MNATPAMIAYPDHVESEHESLKSDVTHRSPLTLRQWNIFRMVELTDGYIKKRNQRMVFQPVLWTCLGSLDRDAVRMVIKTTAKITTRGKITVRRNVSYVGLELVC